LQLTNRKIIATDEFQVSGDRHCGRSSESEGPILKKIFVLAGFDGRARWT
jgi:hypothetical protein